MHFSFFISNFYSGYTRGVQVAEYLNGSVNPEASYENDICIYVKRMHDIDSPVEKSYVDVVDGSGLIWILKDYNDVVPIVFTKTSKEKAENFLKREVIYIPQHHCNYNREVREERDVKTVGFIGCKNSFSFSIGDMAKKLESIGLCFKTFILGRNGEITRNDIVDFYKSIDIQIEYRRYFGRQLPINFQRYKDSTKLINAGSFRIPTVAKPLLNYEVECPNCVIPAYSIDEIVRQCRRLKNDKVFYKDSVDRIFEYTEVRHIDNISKYYLSLKERYV